MAKKVKKPLSAAHRKALVDGQKRRRQRERHELALTMAGAKLISRSPTNKGGRKRGIKKMPEGLHLLRRNGGCRDIVEGDACEISAAVRYWRETKAKFEK